MEICFWNDSFKGSYGCLVNLVSKGRLGIPLGIRRRRYYLGLDTFGMVMVSSFYSPCSRNFWSEILYLWKCIPPLYCMKFNDSYFLRLIIILHLLSMMRNLNHSMRNVMIVR